MGPLILILVAIAVAMTAQIVVNRNPLLPPVEAITTSDGVYEITEGMLWKITQTANGRFYANERTVNAARRFLNSGNYRVVKPRY